MITCLTNEQDAALIEAEEPQESFAQAFIREVHADLNDIKHSFFRIGFRLHEAATNRYYADLGYANITDLAEDKFGFSKSTTYELMGIYELAHRDDAPLMIADSYDKFTQSQLRELCRLKICPTEFMEIVKPSDTVANIGKAVTFWNKYCNKHSGSPYSKTISELLQLDINTPIRETKQNFRRNNTDFSAYAEKSNVEQPVEPAEEVIECELIESKENSAYAENTMPETAQNSAYAEKSEGEPVLSEPRPREEVIAECMRRDSYKNEIYNKYLTNPTREEFIEYIKQMHGTRSGELWCGGYRYREYSPEKGITLTGQGCPNLIISWSVAAATIKKLIEEKSYRTEDELNLHPDEPAPVNPDWDKPSAPSEEFADIEPPAPTVVKEPMTNRTRLEAMTTENFVNELIMQILRIYPLNGKSAGFSSTLRVKLAEWLDAGVNE